jgi:hypothetical protein
MERRAVKYVLGGLVWLGLWLASEVIGEAVAAAVERTVTPVWHRFVGRLNGPGILALWGAAFAATAVPWPAAATAGTERVLSRILRSRTVA